MTGPAGIIIIIPSYNPDTCLIELVQNLTIFNFLKIVVIDDGSFNNAALFEKVELVQNVIVLKHAVNLGKGRALKTAFNYILNTYPAARAVITADADGQHLPKDINALALKLQDGSRIDLVLGTREFSRNIPLRSFLGNWITKSIFNFLIGLKISDTQTGLRGIPLANLKDYLNVLGERYEYETNILLEAKSKNWQIAEVPIETVYIENNKSSHFNPLKDSMRIYFLIFRFLSSSIVSSVADFSVFVLLTNMGIPLFAAVLGSRFVSGWLNFFLNKKIVFKNDSNVKVALIRYWFLVIVMGSISYALLEALKLVSSNIFALKLVVECFLFIASYSVQKEFIFTDKKVSEEK